MRKTSRKKKVSYSEMHHWRHSGDKLIDPGADERSDAELLSIIISTGIKGKSAEKITEEILSEFGSFKGMANQLLKKFLDIKGLGDVKIVRIAAAFEIAKRCVDTVIKELKEDQLFRNEVFGY
jgi:DNA repair protein RadC